MINIYDICIIISGVLAIVFTIKDDIKKALVCLVILFAIMYLRMIGV